VQQQKNAIKSALFCKWTLFYFKNQQKATFCRFCIKKVEKNG